MSDWPQQHAPRLLAKAAGIPAKYDSAHRQYGDRHQFSCWPHGSSSQYQAPLTQFNRARNQDEHSWAPRSCHIPVQPRYVSRIRRKDGEWPRGPEPCGVGYTSRSRCSASHCSLNAFQQRASPGPHATTHTNFPLTCKVMNRLQTWPCRRYLNRAALMLVERPGSSDACGTLQLWTPT